MESKKIIYYKQLDSTNTKLSLLAKQGIVHGTVVTCDSQTAGKGRSGRGWESPEDGNIYMSILLRPQICPSKAPMLTLVMAYSVAKVIKKYGFSEVKIKWPNDLVLSGKKVCGILTEMYLDETNIDYVIVGVGINVNCKNIPEELSGKATSLYLEGGKDISKQQMLEEIVSVFEEDYLQFIQTGDLSFLREPYNEMLINCNREVRILEPGNEYTAYALGIDNLGQLRVRNKEGVETAVFAGEVSVRGVYGYV